MLVNAMILSNLKSFSRALFLLYLPYMLWLCFAAFLNVSIIYLN